MCGRYALFSQKRFELKFKSNINKNYNISPGQKAVVINEENSLKAMNWGIKPNWKKTNIINARLETLNLKKTFYNTKRCVFIADGYFEWQRNSGLKIPFFHYLIDKFLYFAGIYDSSGCCIVTMNSFDYLSNIHSRQPFFLQENQINQWLNKNIKSSAFNEIINFHKVSTKVNMAWNNSSDLIMES